MFIRSGGSLIGALVLFFVPAVARAERPPEPHPLRYTNTIGGQLNPRAFGDDFRVRYRRRLYDAPGAFFQQNFAGAFAGAAVSALTVRPIVGVELQPLSVLSLAVSYSPTYTASALGLPQTYPSPAFDYGSGPLSPPKEGPSESGSLFVHQITFQAAVQAKLGSFFLRSATRMTYVHADPKDGDRVLYDPMHDLAVYRRGWVMQNDSDGGYFFDKKLLFGVRHTLVATWYPSAAFAPGESHETHDSPTSRIGPFVSYTFFEGCGGALDTASLTVATQWYVAHRFRTGAASPAAVPLAGFAFTIAGDL